MAISKNNTKVLLIMPIALKEELKEEARKDNRSLSNYVVTILEKRGKGES